MTACVFRENNAMKIGNGAGIAFGGGLYALTAAAINASYFEYNAALAPSSGQSGTVVKVL